MPAGNDTRTVVFVGAVTQDAIALVDHFPGPDERQVAREVVHAGGGPAATAAVAAARLGIQASLVGAVGADDVGEQILASLRREGVDVTGVEIVPGRPSGSSVVIVDSRRGTRAIATRPVPALTIPITGRAADILSQATWVHVDHLGWEPYQRWLRSGARTESGPRLSVDAGNPIAGFTPMDVDLFVPTLEALVRQYGSRGVDDLLNAAVGAGARTVVATRGAAGSVAATAAGERHEAAGHAVEVVSTLGAGDVFHGALLAAVVRDMPLTACLRYANVTAALSCRGLDGRSAIPPHDEVLAAMPVELAVSSAHHEEIL